MPEIKAEIVNMIADVLQKQHGFATQTQLDRCIADVLKRTGERTARGPSFSLSKMFRGMRAMRGEAINEATREDDVTFVRALTTSGAPGSYLVPTQQAEEIIAALTLGGIARQLGVRIWPMEGVQKMNVPAALTAPAWVWMAQNSIQTPTDPNLGQMAFDLKERRCLIAVPNQLIATSVPAFDTLLADLIGAGAAEHEDTAFFNTTTVSGGPTALYAAASISIIHAANNSANGGNLTYADLLSVIAKAIAVKAKPPFVWAMSPRTFYSRVLGMIDLQSRPIAIPTGVTGLAAPIVGTLLGFPVYVTPFLLENEAVGSGTNQAHLVFTNPKYLHLAQDSSIAIAISTERYFEANQTAIRACQHEDFGYAPAAGIVVLDGIN